MKKRYVCTSCQWKFYRMQKPALCPNCGKNSVEPYTAMLAEDLLKEI
ncbi:FYDLN acid domain-containing protein [Candidatus Woesearchaeota archaeon]|nr:FYDLN acid domain-containing protein [Candidatus Woesearchaeota archaeon]